MKNADLHTHSIYSDGLLSPKDLVKLAKKYNLILTKGTDFHGDEVVKLMSGNHKLGKKCSNEDTIKKLQNT